MYSRKSALPRSQQLPMLASWLKPMPRVSESAAILAACPPLCDMNPAAPTLLTMADGPQGMPCSGQLMPMQLGPMIRKPPARARRAISSSNWTHSVSPVSRNPAVKKQIAPILLEAQSSSRSSTRSRGMEQITRSTGPVMSVSRR